MVAIRRAGLSDLDVLLPLVREFCTIDRHPFEPERVSGALARSSSTTPTVRCG